MSKAVKQLPTDTPSKGNSAQGNNKRRNSTLGEIEKLKKNREDRRKATADARAERAAEEKRNSQLGNPGDVDFQRMIKNFRAQYSQALFKPHTPPGGLKICICVRKRPISEKEIRGKDHDAVTCVNPFAIIHDCKLRVDGISKYLDNSEFQFDHAFSEESTTEEVYFYTTQPLVEYVARGGVGTCFAYGQTGSGKTHTMAGIQHLAAQDLFNLLSRQVCTHDH